MSKPEDKLFKKPEPKEDDLPEAFKGKSPAELAKMIVERDSAIKAKDEEFKMLDGRISNITKLLETPSEKETPVTVKEEKAPDPNTDPEGYYQYMHKKTVEPLAQEAFTRFADYERDKARGKFKDYGKYEPEIEELVKKMPAQMQARKGSFEMAYRMVRAKHLEELEKEMEAKGAAGFSETPSGANRPTPKETVALGDRETAFAKAFGMTPEEYTKWAETSTIE